MCLPDLHTQSCFVCVPWAGSSETYIFAPAPTEDSFVQRKIQENTKCNFSKEDYLKHI